MNRTAVLILGVGMALLATACGEPEEGPYLSNLRATADDPLYTTYAAAMERSQFVLDQGYRFMFWEADQPIRFHTDSGGELAIAFRLGGSVANRLSDMHREPVITASYPDMVSYHYYPYEGIRVEATFLVQRSRAALWDVLLRNESGGPVTLGIFPYMRHRNGRYRELSTGDRGQSIYFMHHEEPDGWTRSHDIPHVSEVYDAFSISRNPDRLGSFRRYGMDEAGTETGADSSAFGRLLEGTAQPFAADRAEVIAFADELRLAAGQSKRFRLARLVSDSADTAAFRAKADSLFSEELRPYLSANERLFSGVPEPEFVDSDRRMLYWSAWNMMRQVFYPPEGKSSYNWYVFSREPTWGWGHGGQVFHESITMMAYAYLDPQGAMNSQRVYRERQHENGYINYRTGAYLDEVIRYEGELTSSAPWYNWINHEVFRITGDTLFLREMYESGRRFYEYYTSKRDKDGDGLAEWGGHAVLESVRDSEVAVWDQVGWPSNFEGVDVNSMLVKEAKALEQMARGLGLNREAEQWRADHERRAERINEVFWDEEEGFYYNADMRDNDFTFRNENDLKRDEIIGFLPMWAGVASERQAARLVERLTDSSRFWRPYGVPSLSADDPYYDPRGYWNGPVWVEWDFMVMQGLLKYGYREEARELVRRVSGNMINRLKKDHTLWEFYSPDESWGGHHQTYIWAGIINRMMMDVMDPPGLTGRRYAPPAPRDTAENWEQ